MAKGSSMSRYDVEKVKQAARGRWRDIIQEAGVSDEFLTTKHGPCPVCKGVTKLRVFSDFDETGGMVCNGNCGKMADGIATIQKLTNRTFSEALSLVAEYLRVEPEERKSKKKSEPQDRFEIIEADPVCEHLGFAAWCLKKEPVTAEALKAVGAKLGRFRWCDESFSIIAIPVWGPKLNEENPVGWVMYEATGQKLPSGKREEVEWSKVRLSAKCGRGLICDPARHKDSKTVLKLEGPPDALAAISQTDIPPEVFPFTTVNGSEETPLPWMIDLATGREAIICHDADQAGERGADKWAGALANKATSARKVVLPYEIEPKHGKDFRDWINNDEGNWEKFQELESEEIESTTIPIDQPKEEDDDPHRLARKNLERYRENFGGRLVYRSNEWWRYKNGRYQPISDSELRAKVTAAIRYEFEICCKAETEKYIEWLSSEDYSPGKDRGAPTIKKVTRTVVTNVIGCMESMCCIPASIQMPCWLPTREKRNYLVMKNGILDLDQLFAGSEQEKYLLPHSSDWFSSCILSYGFDPSATCPKWMEYLNYSLEGDWERISLLQEWAGYLLTGTNDFQRFLALEGEGGNGKTVYFAGITAMLGEQNVSHVTLDKFGDRFSPASMIGKAANISGDTGEIDSVAEGMLKQLTDNKEIQFERKNKDPIDVVSTAKQMIAWNTRPVIKDRTDSVWRRMLIIPFNRKIEQEKIVYGMDSQEWWVKSGETSGILNWAIAGLERLHRNRKFTESKASADTLKNYREESNPASEFINDYLEMSELFCIACKDVYQWYVFWCHENGRRPLSDKSFGRELKRSFPNIIRHKHRDKLERKLTWFYENLNFSVTEILGEKISVTPFYKKSF